MIDRQAMVEQSIQSYVKAALFDERGYKPEQVEFRERFPHTLDEGLERNIVAAAVSFDDESTQAELGSDLVIRPYTILLFVFGETNTWARNLANVLKFAADKEGTIPLLDIEQVPPVEIDKLIVTGASAERQLIPDPEPWQEFVWLTTVKVTDEYHASLA